MRKTSFVIFTVLFILLFAAASFVAALRYRQTVQAEAALASAESAQAQAQKEAEDAVSALRAALNAAEAERDATAARLDELQQKLDGAVDDVLLREGERDELAEGIRLLRIALEEKQAQIASLEADISRYNQVYSIDVRRQAALIDEIVTALEKEAPLRAIARTDKENNPIEPPPEEQIVEEDDTYYYVYPHLALYYEDLSTGYRLAYGEEDVFYSASLIKAPYILWLLETVSAETDAAFARAMEAVQAAAETTAADEPLPLPETTAADASTPETTAPDEPPAPIFLDERYDLSRTFTYTEEAERDGSGTIRLGQFGDVYTYWELVELAVRKSDNVAFAELRNVFGYSDFYNFNTRLGVNSVRRNFNQITAADMARYLRELYRFVEQDENYGELLKSWLCESAHSVMIPYAVYPTAAAHKYGWDEEAYHDAAIVYDEHPYLLVVLTDLDEGGAAIDAYIRRVVQLVGAMHRQFYQ